MLRTISRRVLARDPLVWLILMTTIGLFVFCGLWIYTLVRVQREVALLRVEAQLRSRDRAVRDEAIRKELDTIYATLYSQPNEKQPNIETRRPSAVELWQRTRDKELRDRINRLEQWRLRQER